MRTSCAWLETVEPGATEAFYLKLFVGGLTSTNTLVEQVEQFRADRLELLERLREIEPTNTRERHDRFHWFLLKKGLDDLEADIRWADWVLSALADHASGPIA